MSTIGARAWPGRGPWPCRGPHARPGRSWRASFCGAWALAALLALLASASGCGPSSLASGERDEEGPAAGDGEAHVTVRAVPARRAVLRETVEGLGRCEALPDHLATLTPAVEGHVERLVVAQGGRVGKGDPIVELDPTVARADLQEKTATRDGLRASLALLQSLPRPEERRASELAVEQAAVAVEQARKNRDALRPLVDRREVSEQQFFLAEKTLEQAEIQRKTAEAQLRVMMIGPRPEAVAEAKGRIKTADALVDFSHAHLEYHTIRSPIDGVLELIECHPGQTIAVGAPIGEVVDTRQVFAAVWLPPRSASRVRAGMAARVEPAGEADAGPGIDTDVDADADAPGAGAGRSMAGKVAFVGRVADPQTGNLPVRVLVENPEGRLAIGESLRVAIVLSERPDVLQAPAAAVLDLGEGPVMTVVRDGKAALLHPAPRPPVGGWVEIVGTDLKPGEPVVIEGGYNLPEKTPVLLAGADEGDQGPGEDRAEEKNSEGAGGDEAGDAAKDQAKADEDQAKAGEDGEKAAR